MRRMRFISLAAALAVLGLASLGFDLARPTAEARLNMMELALEIALDERDAALAHVRALEVVVGELEATLEVEQQHVAELQARLRECEEGR